MPSFWKHVKSVLEQSDIIIEVLDARMIEESRNAELEQKVWNLDKKLLYVINKCDLVDVEQLKFEKRHFQPSVYISSTDKLGTTILKKKIMELAHGKEVVVGVVGYPNVGKSSLINALAGRNAARTSPQSGFTKGLQKVRVSQKILLLDTPGVFPYQEKNDVKHGLLGAVDYARTKDPEGVALKLIAEKKDAIELQYGVRGEDVEEVLEALALKWKKLRRGGVPDLEAAARFLLRAWQEGKLR